MFFSTSLLGPLSHSGGRAVEDRDEPGSEDACFDEGVVEAGGDGDDDGGADGDDDDPAVDPETTPFDTAF